MQIKKDVNVTSDLIYVLDKIKYTITVYNAGPCNATNVNVSEVLSPHLKLDHYNATGNTIYNVDKGIFEYCYHVYKAYDDEGNETYYDDSYFNADLTSFSFLSKWSKNKGVPPV